MKRVLVLCVMLLLAKTSLAQDLQKFVGVWTGYGEEMVTIKLSGNSFEIKFPEMPSSELNAKCENIKLDNNKLTFERVIYRTDGQADPDNRKRTYYEVTPTESGKLRCRLASTPDMENVPEFLLRNSLSTDQESSPASQNPDLMKAVFSLGAGNAKFDQERNVRQDFDEDGRLTAESYLDQDNNIVVREYREGQMLYEVKITPEDLDDGAELGQIHHKEDTVPAIKSVLQSLSTAAENFAKDHEGNYPKSMGDLSKADPPYLDECTCDQEIKMYRIKCETNSSGYSFIAHAIWSHQESYVVTTGGKWEIKKPGALGRAIPFKPSQSPCVE